MSASSPSMDRGHFYFDPDDPIYRDHFPGQAVVPGNLVIHAFMQAARRLKTDRPALSIENFRFKRFLSPGRYAFQMERMGNGRLACKLFDRESVVVTGIL